MQHSPDHQLNEFLRTKLEAANCTGGRLECRLTAILLVTLHGQRNHGKPILFWDLERPLKRLLDAYLAAAAPDAAALIIDIDLPNNKFLYHHISRQEAAAQEAQEAAQRKSEEEQHLREIKLRISSQGTPYGQELANKVADALQHGTLAHSHRDYCGMGLERDGDGQYLYGEVWDGGLVTPLQIFPDRTAFVSWLAAQSDASMARLDTPDTWYWNNQVINRERLEAFVQGY
jgi:hypothetical protein